MIAWITAHGLEELWAPLLRTTTAWIASAAPTWASEPARTLACMDLGTCFFILDDSADDVALARYDDLEHVATGGSPHPERPLQRAFASLFARVAVHGPIDHYLALRRDFARALRTRHAIRTGCTTTDVEAYIALREITIYFAPWLSLWEAVGEFVLAPAERARVASAFVPSNRWQALENERVSIARDASSGTPNVVALVAAARDCPLDEAAAIVAARAEAELVTYRAALVDLRATGLIPATARYLDTLEQGVDGAIRHHVSADPSRYY